MQLQYIRLLEGAYAGLREAIDCLRRISETFETHRAAPNHDHVQGFPIKAEAATAKLRSLFSDAPPF
jgi:hypothetical protein